MDNLTMLHLSDLHFEPSTFRDMNIVKDALFKDLQTFRDQGVAPEIVLFSGDLIYAGDFGYSEERNDFDTVRNEFIMPLLELLGLDTDHLFICPGNHDIQRSEVDKHKYLECGLKESLKDRDSVNAFIDDLENQKDALARMTNFGKFEKSLKSKLQIRSNVLFSTYSLNLHGKKIGIACINSAWRAYGGSGDYGKLLIGERTIDSCINDLEGCNLRIGVMHHPFEYLDEFERVELKRRIFGTFNIWLHGHTHEPDFNFVQTFNNESIVVIAGGTLYKSRDYHNGYSFIRFSLTEGSGQVYLREYDNRRRRFSAASAYAANEGIESFRLAQTSIIPLNGNLSLISQIRSSVVDSVNRLLLPVTSDRSAMLKDLRSIFVEPLLSTESEYVHAGKLARRHEEEENFVELEDVLRSGKNILFLGRKESGKSTLLNYICVRYLEPSSLDKVRVPLLINYQRLPKGKNRIKKALLNYIADFSIGFDLEESLGQGNCLILIDDFEYRDRKNLADLIQFVEDYPKNRFMLTGDESLFLDEEFLKPPELGIDYDRLYIHSFGKRQIRSLVGKWFEGILTEPQAAELTEQVLLNLVATNIPRSPLTISLLLLIIEQQGIEQQGNFVPINKASLLEKLVEILLEKMGPTEETAGSIDYRNREHFLSYLASYMVSEDNYQLTIDELRRVTNRYFEKRGLTIPRGTQFFIEDLINKGILFQSNGQIRFRFRCFGEFFIAKYMIEDRSFYEQILSEDWYLTFSHEIDYLTGLQRNNRDLVEFIRARSQESVDEYLNHVGLEVHLEHFDRIELRQSVLDTLFEEEKHTLERLLEDHSDLDDEEVQQVVEGVKDFAKGLHEQRIVKLSYEDYKLWVLNNLVLFASVIKNCELIDDKLFKRENVRVCLQSFLKILFVFILGAEEFIRAMDKGEVLQQCSKLGLDDVLDNEEAARTRLRAVTLLMWFLFLQEILSYQLATPKLRIVLEEEINESSNHPLLRLMCAVLYANLRLPGAIDKLESILKEVRKNKLYRRILLTRLAIYYVMRLHSPHELRHIENLLAEAIAADQDIPPRLKSKVVAQLKNLYWHDLT